MQKISSSYLGIFTITKTYELWAQYTDAIDHLTSYLAYSWHKFLHTKNMHTYVVAENILIFYLNIILRKMLSPLIKFISLISDCRHARELEGIFVSFIRVGTSSAGYNFGVRYYPIWSKEVEFFV